MFSSLKFYVFIFFQLTGLFVYIFLNFCLELWKRIWTITFSSNYHSSHFSVYVFRFSFCFCSACKNNEIIVMTISGCIICAVNNYVVLLTVCLVLRSLFYKLERNKYYFIFSAHYRSYGDWTLFNINVCRFCIYDAKKILITQSRILKFCYLFYLPLGIKENLMTKIYSAEAKRKAE